MYAVVGCRECDALWVIQGGTETAQCARCGTRHRTDRLRRLFEHEDANRVRQARTELLRKRSEHGDAVDGLDDFASLGERIELREGGDPADIRAAGLDPDALEAAATGSSTPGGTRREVVLDAIETLESPTREAILEYAAARGCPAEAADSILEALRRSGDVARSGQSFRRL